MSEAVPGPGEVRRAAQRIAHWVRRTPVCTSESIDRLVGARLFFKCENMQRVGAFKFRGASNALLALGDRALARGVATHSSGNHGQALALAARLRGVTATVVMPENSSRVKRAAVAAFGARCVLCEPTQEGRERGLARVIEETGARTVHPFADPMVIAGQGTAALELLEQVPDLDAVLVPVGGGGLLGGTALAVAGQAPAVAVIGAEPEGADDFCRSMEAGQVVGIEAPHTVADGLRTARTSELNFAIAQRHVQRLVRVAEADTIAAMRLLWERTKLLVEPSSAVPLGALLGGALQLPGKRVGVVLSGGNVDLDRLPWQDTRG